MNSGTPETDEPQVEQFEYNDAYVSLRTTMWQMKRSSDEAFPRIRR